MTAVKLSNKPPVTDAWRRRPHVLIKLPFGYRLLMVFGYDNR